MADDQRIDYGKTGYNGFFRRTLNGNPNELTLKTVGSARNYRPQSINFDEVQTDGALGDTFRTGRVFIRGSLGRIDIEDTEANPVVRLGDQED